MPLPFGMWRWEVLKHVYLVIIGRLQFSLEGGIWYFRDRCLQALESPYLMRRVRIKLHSATHMFKQPFPSPSVCNKLYKLMWTQQWLRQKHSQTKEGVQYLNNNYYIKWECSGSSKLEVTSCWGAEGEGEREASGGSASLNWILKNGLEFTGNLICSETYVLVYLCHWF